MINILKIEKLAGNLFYWTEIMEIIVKHVKEYPTEEKEHLSVLASHIHELTDELIYEFVNENEKI